MNKCEMMGLSGDFNALLAAYVYGNKSDYAETLKKVNPAIWRILKVMLDDYDELEFPKCDTPEACTPEVNVEEENGYDAEKDDFLGFDADEEDLLHDKKNEEEEEYGPQKNYAIDNKDFDDNPTKEDYLDLLKDLCEKIYGASEHPWISKINEICNWDDILESLSSNETAEEKFGTVLDNMKDSEIKSYVKQLKAGKELELPDDVLNELKEYLFEHEDNFSIKCFNNKIKVKFY